jgi:predicted lactoylglutathione lyase
MKIENAAFKANNEGSVVKPYVMSHGTLEVQNLQKSRRFYEQFLGLECVRHVKPGMVVRCGMKFHIVCIEVGNAIRPSSFLTHWGLDLESRAAVDDAYTNAQKLKDEYGIRRITPCVLQHGVYSFYIEDLDHNWWEFQYYDGFQHDDMYDFGDVVPADEPAGTAHLSQLDLDK